MKLNGVGHRLSSVNTIPPEKEVLPQLQFKPLSNKQQDQFMGTGLGEEAN